MTKKPRRQGAPKQAAAAADTIALDLTQAQTEQLGPLLRRRGARRALLLMTPMPFWSVEEGRMRFHLRVKFLPQARARYVLKYLQEDAGGGA